jgi:two-component system, cell cycle response regulator
MHKQGTFALALRGLTDSECRVVKSLCTLSSNRPRSYNVVSPLDADKADLWIVDGKDQSALAALHVARSKRRVPAILIDAAASSADLDAHIGRPIVASRLMSALDLLVTKGMDYFPELVIGGGTSQSPSANGRLTDALNASTYSRSHTALVVDDSVTIRKQVELALRLHDIEATCVDSDESAMSLLASKSFDIIFLDVVLPGGRDGYQICRSIKSSSVHKTTPVVMLTGRSSPFDRVRGSLAGCDTYLTKPVENHTFNKVLKKYLKTHHVPVAIGA